MAAPGVARPGAGDLDRCLRELRAAAAALRRSNRELLASLAGAGPVRLPEPRPPDAELVRRARARAGLTQGELARRLHYSRSALAEAERGRRRMPERIVAWARRVASAGAPTGTAS